MRRAPAIVLVSFALALGACQKSGEPYQAATPQPVNTSSAVVGKPVEPASSTPETAPKPATFDSIPADLKNDAFHYYGLSSNKVKTYKIQISNAPNSGGSQTVSFSGVEVDPNQVLFEEQDSGSPTNTIQSMSLDAKGIYVESIKPQTLKTPHFLELPATLAVGTQWTSHQSVDSGSESLDENLEYKVVGNRQLKTPAGTFQAMYIVGTGNGNLGAAPARMKVESWFVKDVGLVKQVATIYGKGINSTIQQTLLK